MAATLADNGRNPVTHNQVVSPEHVPEFAGGDGNCRLVLQFRPMAFHNRTAR
jgi:hypothetical protein